MIITLHICTTEQTLKDLELATYQAGRAHYESIGRTFTDAGFLRSVDGNGNDIADSIGTDYRQEVRFDDELNAFWIKSASNFGLAPEMVAGLQAMADSYEGVTTIDHEFSLEEVL